MNQPNVELETDAFILDVDTCLYQEMPYVIQRIYYLGSGKEYVRGLYVKDGITKEIHKDWSKK